jgi:hypothetical protein
MLPRVFFFLLSLGGGGVGGRVFQNRKPADFHGKNIYIYGALYLFNKSPFFFHCEPALGSSLALTKFSFRLDKGCTPQTPPPPQFIEPNDPIIFRNTHVQGAFCITKKDLNKNFIMVQ